MTAEAGTVIGVVLAGGRSRRMGTDKALLRRHGRTWLETARALLRQSGADRVVILGRPDEPDGMADPVPGAGPAVNLAALMASLPAGTRLLVVPVDMPTLDPALLTLLAARPAGGAPSGDVLPAAVIVPRHPVRPAGQSLRALWASLGVPEVALPSGSVPHNLNTPEQLSALQDGALEWT